MQTAVEYLFETLWDCPKDKLTWYSILEKAKKMERLQLIDAQSYAISNADMTNNRGYFDCDKWYNETYGSKGSDEIKKAEEMGLYDKIELANPNDSIFTSSQTEISDEEIEKAWDSYKLECLEKFMKDTTIAGYAITNKETFAKWYREQLKKKI